MNKITKEVWKEIDVLLKKHKLSYTAHFEPRDLYNTSSNTVVTVYDKYFEVLAYIPDFFEDGVEDETN